MKNVSSLQDIAVFRFSLIAPLVAETSNASSKSEYYRQVASKTHKYPDGSEVKYSSNAIKKWYLDYQKGGLDALFPKTRNDLGKPRNLNQAAIEKIHEYKEKFPYITGTLIYKKLIEDGYIKANATSKSTVLRYIRENGLSRKEIVPKDRRAFEMEFANDCWQADTSHGPIITVNGVKKQTYLITFIDDASRLIVDGEFFFNDNSINMQKVFKNAILNYGIPKKIFLDNGTPYKNNQIKLICASLGTVLIYTRAYSPESKGKIERVFRTVKDNWINGVDWNEFSSLDDLTSEFRKYLDQEYNNNVHSSINNTPHSRYLKDFEKIKRIPPEQLENHFLHRVTRRVYGDSTIKLNKDTFEVPVKYIGQTINIRYYPIDLKEAYIFDERNNLLNTIYPVNKIDNSKSKRKQKPLDYSKINGGANNV